jgi:hypothetical protein
VSAQQGFERTAIPGNRGGNKLSVWIIRHRSNGSDPHGPDQVSLI